MRRKTPLLRGLAILAVVCNHATGQGLLAMIWWTHRYRGVAAPNYDQVGAFPFWVLVTLNQLALFSVPAFFFISGLHAEYAAQGRSLRSRWEVARARTLGLLVPYLVWSTVVFTLDALLGTSHSAAEYARRLLTGGAVDAYFFIPLLVQFYLLSPFIARWTRAAPKTMLVLSGLLQGVSTGLHYTSGIWAIPVALQTMAAILSGTWIRWSFFSVLGIAVALHAKQTQHWLRRHRTLLALGAVLLGAVASLEPHVIYRATTDWAWAYDSFKVSSALYAVSFILAFMAWGISRSAFTRRVERIGRLSYGIYLMHPKGLELLARAVYNLWPGLLGSQLVLSGLMFVLAVGGSYLVMHVVAKSPLRKVYHYVFG